MEIDQRMLSAVQTRLAKECDRIGQTVDGLSFRLGHIAGEEDWKIFGNVRFVSASPGGENQPDLMGVELIVLRDVPETLFSEVQMRLHELGKLTLFGNLILDDKHQVCYRYACPMAGRSAEETADLFEFVCYEMVTFVDTYYPYLLICVTELERMTLTGYMEQLLQQAAKDSEEA